MYNNPIGIFDSGVGGLSILKSVKKLLPYETFLYIADQKNNPYGGRSIEEIQMLSSKVATFLTNKKVKLIIIACNTVSVNAIDHLRSEFKTPIIAVVPVVKTIAERTATGRAAVFSTPATAKSAYLEKMIKKFGKGVDIYSVGNSKLEYLVEDGIISGPEIETALKNSMLPLLEKNVDSIALGCTHYPFLIPEIKKIVGAKAKIYTSGGAIARRTHYVLSYESLLADKKGKDTYFTTGDPEKFEKIAGKLLKEEIGFVEEVEL